MKMYSRDELMNNKFGNDDGDEDDGDSDDEDNFPGKLVENKHFTMLNLKILPFPHIVNVFGFFFFPV